MDVNDFMDLFLIFLALHSFLVSFALIYVRHYGLLTQSPL
jgi:hypothetical protein